MTSLSARTDSLGERLATRRPEIEQTILARVYAVSDPTEARDPEYVAGLRAAVAAAVSYGLSVTEGGGGHTAPVPPALFAQARHAARNGVSLDTVLRRYFAGYTLLGDFIMQEAEALHKFEAEDIHRLLRAQAAIFDRLVVAVTEEYRYEADSRSRSIEHARIERVKSLLAGKLVDPAALGYELDGWHLAVIAVGSEASRVVRDLFTSLGHRRLLVSPGEATAWAWLGNRHRVEAEDLGRLVVADRHPGLTLAIGEPGDGVAGWRLTHHQAMAALPIALRDPGRFVRYADVSLLASALQDRVLVESLNELYMAPLTEDRDGGATLRLTLRAYFAAERNVSSAASALGVSRKTVAARLQSIEQRLHRSLPTCAAELGMALHLEEINELTPDSVLSFDSADGKL